MKLKDMEVKYLETKEGKIPTIINDINLWDKSSFYFKVSNIEGLLEVRRYDDSFYGTTYSITHEVETEETKEFLAPKRKRWDTKRFKASEINWDELELVGMNRCVDYSSGRCWSDEKDHFVYNSKILPYPQKEDVEGCGCCGWDQTPEPILDKYKSLGLDSMLIIKSYHDSSD